MYTELLLIFLGLLVWVWTYRWARGIGKRSSLSITVPGFAGAYMRSIIARMLFGAFLVLMGVFMLLDILRFPSIVLP